LIARDSGNGQQINSRMMGSKQNSNGIIMTGITVEDDFMFHEVALLDSVGILAAL